MRLGRAGVVAVVGYSCVLLVVALASAARITGKSKTEELPGDATTHLVTLKCPEGAKASGGGIRLSDANGDYAQGSYPSGRRGWTAAGYNQEPPSTELTAFARCLRGAPVSTESETAPVPDTNASGTGVVARCPRGSALVGGGLEIDDDDVLETAGSHPAGARGWRAVARPSPTAGSVTATARCSRGAEVIRRTKSMEMPNDDVTHTVTATCPRDTKLTGGGTRLGKPDSEYFQGSYPTGRRSWTAAGFDDGRLTAIALCLKRG